MDIDVEDTIARVASSLRKQYPMVERDDIVQELWVYYLSKDFSHANSKMLWTSLRRAGARWCSKEKAAVVGYEEQDLYHYSIGQIQELLPLAFNRNAWTLRGKEQVEGKAGGDPAHGNSHLAMICDVRSGLETGSAEDKALLWTAYGLGLDSTEHALSLGLTDAALRMRLNRAMQRLQRRLGGPKPSERDYVGTRRVLSNAASQAITRNQEGSDG